MREPPQIRLLPDGRRLHLQDGPIDLIVQAFGAEKAVAAAYRAAAQRFTGLLDELCAELSILRAQACDSTPPARSPVANRMQAAVAPYAAERFITPMAAVAGSVAEAILDAMLRAAALERAYVNNGGDIALHLAAGRRFVIGLVGRPDRPSLFGRSVLDAASGIRGIATSGWRGRSFSLGIADAVTVLAATAADADAAATVIANDVDLPDHPAVQRVPANQLQPDSDLGSRLITCAVGPLPLADIAAALARGISTAEQLCARGLIHSAALHVQGSTQVVGSGTTRIDGRAA
jgi:uncharacterized protein